MRQLQAQRNWLHAHLKCATANINDRHIWSNLVSISQLSHQQQLNMMKGLRHNYGIAKIFLPFKLKNADHQLNWHKQIKMMATETHTWKVSAKSPLLWLSLSPEQLVVVMSVLLSHHEIGSKDMPITCHSSVCMLSMSHFNGTATGCHCKLLTFRDWPTAYWSALHDVLVWRRSTLRQVTFAAAGAQQPQVARISREEKFAGNWLSVCLSTSTTHNAGLLHLLLPN